MKGCTRCRIAHALATLDFFMVGGLIGLSLIMGVMAIYCLHTFHPVGTLLLGAWSASWAGFAHQEYDSADQSMRELQECYHDEP